MANSPPFGSGPDRNAVEDAAYRDLHGQRAALERELLLVQQQQRFGSDTAEIDAARDRERSLLRDLDRVLTMIRAAEVRRRNGSAAKRWQ